MRTDDPIRDFNHHDASQRAWLSTRPICDCCGEPIQDEYYYELPKIGKWCEGCLDEGKKYIDDPETDR